MQNKWRYEPRKLKGHKSIFHFQPPELEGGGGGGEVSPSTDLLQTLHGTFLQVYKIENKVYCCNYNFKSEMPTLLRNGEILPVSVRTLGVAALLSSTKTKEG